jgi:DNA (cytosine-5)-methyltransferase 1
MRPNKANNITAIDVFAGGGGLTVGLKRAGFNVFSAIEIEDNAYATYKANHPEVNAFKQDVKTINGEHLRQLSPTGSVDLLAGCPPCQGFCSLTSKYRKEDLRNELIFEFARLVKEITPQMVMLENVPGLIQRGKSLFDKFVNILIDIGYLISFDVLQTANFGIPQNRRRLVLLAGLGFKIPMPTPTHSNEKGSNLKPWENIRSVIKSMPTPVTLSTAIAKGGPLLFNWHIVRDISPQNMRRLIMAKPGKNRNELPKTLRPKCHKNREDGFSNVYGRASWDHVSPTITGGCTTISKGRFGHPEEDRTFSVRESAMIQTFPPNYFFDTNYMEHVCNIIGNALPCDFAEILARQCLKYYKTSKIAN